MLYAIIEVRRRKVGLRGREQVGIRGGRGGTIQKVITNKVAKAVETVRGVRRKGVRRGDWEVIVTLHRINVHQGWTEVGQYGCKTRLSDSCRTEE